ncbi:hypothetical protein GCM10025886_18230 [Tetragenococcus halophilus subsp. flandriensis]|uniref:MerR family transcriptional regulator n=1 Tax=Tetragenococcus halophilus TaxID=51669 RepID=UPI0023E9A280|nr:MerR family DNA-binding transcriptional regulator [Tetragenococcus halophilus]GMA08672.1 hypothetical protein GCM10025886_18230 [Tetragenococcus halophilus subsp. flandriensis]
MKEYYSIGETAKLNNITIQTLRYYDKIGIFKPSYINLQNGYRFYHIKQFFYLDIIKYLKYIRTPLDEIKDIITWNPEQMLSFLSEQETVIENEREQLERSKRLLDRRKSQLKEQLDIWTKKQENTVYTRTMPKQFIVRVETATTDSFNQAEFYFRKLAQMLEERGDVIDNYYGYIYHLDPYTDQDEISCNCIFTTINKEEKIDLIEDEVCLDSIPAGEYVCISFDWSTNNYLSYYKKLYNYITTNHIQTNGKVYQVSLPINFSSLKEEQFLTELKVLKTN